MHRRIHRNVERAYQENGHDLSHHPFFIKYNSNYPEAFQQSKSAFEKAHELKADESSDAIGRIKELLYEIINLEENHVKELEQTAIDIVHDVWRVPKSMLKVKITGPEIKKNSKMNKSKPSKDQMEPQEELDPELQKHVDHRVMMKTFSQGFSVYQCHTMFHMAGERLNSIDPSLVSMYKKFSTSATHQYWLMDVANILAASGSDELGKTNSKNGIIYCEGACFPVLLHELVKGIVSYIATSKQFGMNKQLKDKPLAEKEKIAKNADKYIYEPWQIMMGPLIVKKLTDILVKIRKERGITIRNEEFMSKIAQMDPDEAQDLITSIMEMPEIAEDLVAQMASKK